MSKAGTENPREMQQGAEEMGSDDGNDLGHEEERESSDDRSVNEEHGADDRSITTGDSSISQVYTSNRRTLVPKQKSSSVKTHALVNKSSNLSKT